MGMSSAVKVSIRVRPFNRREINANAELAIQGNFIIREPIQLSYIFRFFFRRNLTNVEVTKSDCLRFELRGRHKFDQVIKLSNYWTKIIEYCLISWTRIEFCFRKIPWKLDPTIFD